MKGGDFTDGGITQTIEINLMDRTTNSLKQLNQYVAKLGEVYEAQKEKRKAEMAGMEDVAPAVDTIESASPAKRK